MEHISLEQPIVEIEEKIDGLRKLGVSRVINFDQEIKKLKAKAKKLRTQIFADLSPYQKTQLARHPRRPNSLELITAMCDDFVELHGDRNYQDDKAIIGGLAMLAKHPVVIIGHQKGRGTKDNIFRNFGMPRPEGYRKALRLMSMAERYHLPIVTLIDTPGAYPGVGAEERGQSEAIAKNIMVMSRLKVPIVSVVIGEGGSGGALALAVANRVHMLAYAVYSVISPEGCASILFKDAKRAPEAAGALKLTADDAQKFGLLDSIISEPEGGAHQSIDQTAANILATVDRDLNELALMSGAELRAHRREKFLHIDACAFKATP